MIVLKGLVRRVWGVGVRVGVAAARGRR